MQTHNPRIHGLSIVELMIGIAIGLFVLAGAAMVATGQVSDNRRLLLETQVQQDLRAAADMVARELRRGGYWGSAAGAVWPTAPAVANPYAAVWTAGGGAELMYSFSNVGPGVPENGAMDDAEIFGFRRNIESGTIQMKVGGGGWQTLTDPAVLRVTQFDFQVNEQNVALPCAKSCPGGGVACWPQQVVRDVSVVIAGEAVHDVRVQRSLRSDVKVRNDGVSGTCPA